jgi:hypoxanthine phosphoribosyltransferase
MTGESLTVWILQTLVAALIGILLNRLVGFVRLDTRWWNLLAGLIVLLLAVAAGTQVIFAWLLTSGKLPQEDALQKFGLILLAQFVLAFTLYFVMKARRRQCTRPFPVQFTGDRDPVEVCRLIQSGIHLGKRLEMTWETFGEGVDSLVRQIETPKNKFEPDLCFGLNPSGMFVAAHVVARIKYGSRHLGFLAIGGADRRVRYASLPKDLDKGEIIKDIETILIVDNEVKSGDSLKGAADFLKQTYGERVDIRFAVLSACKVRGKIERIIQLNQKHGKGVFRQDDKYLPHFLAFVAPGRVWMPGKTP